jgi:hypothetical protein
MLIGSLTDGSLVLGLDRTNIERLTKGQPIRISPESHPDSAAGDLRIYIMFGETLQAIVDDLNAGARRPS